GHCLDRDVVHARTGTPDGQYRVRYFHAVHVEGAHDDGVRADRLRRHLVAFFRQTLQPGSGDIVQCSNLVHVDTSGLAGSSPVCSFEVAHELDQPVHALFRHRVVYGGTHAADGTMTF